jgi:hypothetical protein
VEVVRIWDVKAEMIPVTTGTPGTISKSSIKYLSNVLGEKNNTKELQKTAILGTAHLQNYS